MDEDSALTSRTELQAEIANRLRHGEPLVRVDDEVIRASPFSDDEQAALWLYGWCLLERRQTRKGGAPTQGTPGPGGRSVRRPPGGRAAVGR